MDVVAGVVHNIVRDDGIQRHLRRGLLEGRQTIE